MATNFQSRGIVCFGKRFFNQIRAGGTRDPTLSHSLSLRRAVHVSQYDKNLDDEVPTIVPDDVVQPESDKYWGPHPQTGVFGPETEQNPSTDGERAFHSSPGNGGEGSVLEEKAFFRPLEDLEKPPNP